MKKKEEINEILKLGTTRVEIGVQTLKDRILKITNIKIKGSSVFVKLYDKFETIEINNKLIDSILFLIIKFFCLRNLYKF